MVNDILTLFIDERTIEILGNWYPRVYAVMSCVIPFTFIVMSFVLVGSIVLLLCRAMLK